MSSLMQEMNRDKSSEDIIVDSPIANTDEEPTFAPSGSDEQADYSQEYTPYTVSSMLVPGAALNVPGISLPAAASVDYLFVDEARQRGERGWSEKACYNTGVTYGMGLMVGGAWGFFEGLRQPVPNNTKLRLNAILNGCTRRGPLVGNSAGVLTLMYTSVDHALYKMRKGEDDIINHTIAGGAAGVIFKSTAGLKVAARTGAVFAGIAAALSGAYSLYERS